MQKTYFYRGLFYLMGLLILALGITLNTKTREAEPLVIGGRHDPCIVPRAVPCIEAAAAIAVYDALLDRRKEQI